MFVLLIFIFLSCSSVDKYEVDLTEKTKLILEHFSESQSEYIHFSKLDKGNSFYELQAIKEDERTIRFEVYLIEKSLDNSEANVNGHASFRGFDVLIYNELNDIFYKINASKEFVYSKQKSTVEDMLYDPPYWNLYFDTKGRLLRTYPKEVFEELMHLEIFNH